MKRSRISRIAVRSCEVDRHREVHRRSSLNVIDERQTLFDVEAFDKDDAGVFVAALLLFNVVDALKTFLFDDRDAQLLQVGDEGTDVVVGTVRVPVVNIKLEAPIVITVAEFDDRFLKRFPCRIESVLDDLASMHH